MKPYVEDVSMRRCIKIASKLFLILIAYASVGQNIPLDTWRSHYSYSSVKLLSLGNEKIYGAASNGIFSVDLQEKSLMTINKTDGLSDVGASAIKFDPETQTLIIGYPSGLLDLITDTGITTLREINKTNLLGDKKINDILILDAKAYLATSFGVIVVDLAHQEITETYGSIGPEGSNITAYELGYLGTQLFISTQLGVQSGSLDDNLLDFNNWTHYNNPGSNQYYGFATVNDSIYSIRDYEDLVVLKEGFWQVLPSMIEEPLIKLHSDNEQLFILAPDQIIQYQTGEFATYRSLTTNAVNDFLFSGGFWVGDDQQGLIDPNNESVMPNGTLSDQISKIRFLGGNIYIFYATDPLNFFGQSTHNQYSKFNGSVWQTESIPGFNNISDVAAFNGGLFFGSIGDGLYDQQQNLILNEENSTFTAGKTGLGPIVPELVTAGDQLLIPLFNNDNPLYTLSTSGNLDAYSETYVGTDSPIAIDLSQANTLWLTRSPSDGGGIIALDLTTNDYRMITSNDNLPSSNINDIAINRDDEVWLATSSGPSFFSDGSFIFNTQEATSPIYDGFNLFDGLPITAIAIDGGNRIWMGNNDGVWVFDEAISQKIHHFTTSNSPIPSNNILEFAYHRQTGEMFVLTAKGLVSYRSSSSSPGTTHSQVSIFPNPVTPNYTGLVAISGVVEGAQVKVTDVNGKLIRELTVNGGTASWNLQDYNNRRVSDGVYILFSADPTGEDTYIGKLAVIN